MKLEVIKTSNYRVFDWSGGTTTELYISPQAENFKNRTFDYRLSSAGFSTTASEFSDFTGYRRFIIALKGTLYLERLGQQGVSLKPYEPYEFDGSWKLSSKNSPDCIDFNFIVRKDYNAVMEVHERGESLLLHRGHNAFIYSEGLSLEVLQNGVFLCSLGLSERRLINVLAEEADLELRLKKALNPVIVCKIS